LGVVPVQVQNRTRATGGLCELVAPRVGLTGKGHQMLVLLASVIYRHNEPVLKMLRFDE